MTPFAGLVRRRKIAAAGALRRGGDPAGAIDELAPVLAAIPEDPAANVEMARALQLLEDFGGAEEHYRRALAAQLDYTLVVELAGAVGAQGRTGESDELLDAALDIAAADSTLDVGEVHFMRAMVAAGTGRRDEAREALAMIPESSGAQLKQFAGKLAARLEAPQEEPQS